MDFSKFLNSLVFKIYQGQLLQEVFRINRYAHKKYFNPDKSAILCVSRMPNLASFLMKICLKRTQKILNTENIPTKFLQGKSNSF
jgi:hypothetical protein